MDNSYQQAPRIHENEISGGTHELTIQGGEYRKFIHNQVNQTYHADTATGRFGPPLQSGAYRVSSLISVLEKEPICTYSRIFPAILHSNVTGDKKIVVKITPADEKHQRGAKIHFSVPHHENIVERIATDVFNYRGQPSIYIAMECCDCNLYDHIRSQVMDGIPFDPQKYFSIAYQILVALEFLHSQNVVHGDLKPSNVLLLLNGNIAKLSDFGLSRVITCDKTSTQLVSPQGGTVGWQGPEILKGTTRIAPENDIFPLGLVIFHTWSYGKHPYGNEPNSWNHYILFGENRNLEGILIPNADSAKVLLESMLKCNPSDRPTANDILKNRLFISQRSIRPNHVNDAQVEEVVAKAFRAMSRTDTEMIEVDNELCPLGVTIAQLSNAMKKVWDQSRACVSTPLSASQGATTQPKKLFGEASQADADSLQQTLNPSPDGGFTTAPLCQHRCDVILMSDFANDKCHLSKLSSLIHSPAHCYGSGEFLQCDDGSDPTAIQERLLCLPTCKDGITLIAVAYRLAAIPLRNAIEGFGDFLRNKGLCGEDLSQRLESVGKNLAVFTMSPMTYISLDSAKVVVNIYLSNEKDSDTGRLIVEEGRFGKIDNKITFHDANYNFANNFLFSPLRFYINNAEVMKIIKKALCQDSRIRCCEPH